MPPFGDGIKAANPGEPGRVVNVVALRAAKALVFLSFSRRAARTLFSPRLRRHLLC
jgi:hypothetical protein